MCIYAQPTKKKIKDYQRTVKAHSLTVSKQHDKTMVYVLIQIIRTIS
jgi:hypothetical protein